jgi:hypothetical protein
MRPTNAADELGWRPADVVYGPGVAFRLFGWSTDRLAARAHRRLSAKEPSRRHAIVRCGHAGLDGFALSWLPAGARPAYSAMHSRPRERRVGREAQNDGIRALP